MSNKTVFIPTDEQRKILEIKEGTHLELAPPGSGKTELLANRVEEAFKYGFLDDEMICLIARGNLKTGLSVLNNTHN